MTCFLKRKGHCADPGLVHLQEDYYCDGYTVWYICFVAVFVGSLWAVAVVSHAARAFAVLFCQPTTLSFKSVSRSSLRSELCFKSVVLLSRQRWGCAGGEERPLVAGVLCAHAGSHHHLRTPTTAR